MTEPRRRDRTAESGFTLIELMIVVTIIGILAGIAIVQQRRAITKAQEAALRADLTEMRKAIDNFYADKQHYPQDLNELVPRYIRKIPPDPITKKDDWVVDQADPNDPNSPSGNTDTSGSGSLGAPLTPGIVDVHSAAQGKTQDGVNYGDL